jgi:hypothetical protein
VINEQHKLTAFNELEPLRQDRYGIQIDILLNFFACSFKVNFPMQNEIMQRSRQEQSFANKAPMVQFCSRFVAIFSFS